MFKNQPPPKRPSRPRGPTKHVYTAEQVAKQAGITIGTLRAYQARGKVDLRVFESVVDFIHQRKVAEWRRTQLAMFERARWGMR